LTPHLFQRLCTAEYTASAYTSPDTRYGFAAWTAELYGVTVVFTAYIASPPGHLEVIATAILCGTPYQGTLREIALHIENLGLRPVWIDNK